MNTERDVVCLLVHTAQAIFETRPSIWLMCRINTEDRCQIRWYNPEEQLIDLSSGNSTDLVLHNSTFDEHMGLYSCQICCSNKCRKLTTFIYPVSRDKVIDTFSQTSIDLGCHRQMNPTTKKKKKKKISFLFPLVIRSVEEIKFRSIDTLGEEK